MNKCIALALSIFFLSSSAQSQTTVEVSKITCQQFVLFKIANPKNIAIWLSGYYNGRRGVTSIDMTLLEERADKLAAFCHGNLNVFVMDAAQKVFAIPNTK